MSGFLDDFDPLQGATPSGGKKKAKKPVQRAPPSDDEEEEEPVPQPVKKAKKKVVAPPPDSDEEEEEPAPVPVKKAKKPVVRQPVEEDDEEEEEPAPAPVKKKASAPVAAAPVAVAKPAAKKKKPVISSSSSSSSSSDSSDEEGQPPRRKKAPAKKAAAGVASTPQAAPVAAAPAKKSGSSGPVPQATLFDFGDDAPFGSAQPAAIMPPAAVAPKKKKVKQPVVEESSDSSEDSEPETPPPQPKKKPAKKAAARAPADEQVPATSMASFLGDETDEALEGFNDLEVRPTKRTAQPKRQPQQQQQRRPDPGLDGDDGYGDQGQQEYDDEGEVYSPHADNGRPAIANAGGVGGRKKSPKDWRIDFENTSTSMGMNKNIVTWTFVWKRQVHSVQLHHSTFGGKRKVLVDDRVRIQEKKPFADQSRYDLRIGEGPLSVNIGVQIKAAGLTAFTYELYIERQPYDQAQKFWLTHPDA